MSTENERKLFVTGLPDSMTDDVLRQLFDARIQTTGAANRTFGSRSSHEVSKVVSDFRDVAQDAGVIDVASSQELQSSKQISRFLALLQLSKPAAALAELLP